MQTYEFNRIVEEGQGSNSNELTLEGRNTIEDAKNRLSGGI